MSVVQRQFESKHAIVRVSIESKSTEGHSLLSEQRAEYSSVLGTIVAPGSNADAIAIGVGVLHHFDSAVDAAMKAKG